MTYSENSDNFENFNHTPLRRSSLRVCSWNVRSLSDRSRILVLIGLMKKYRIDVLALQETKLYDGGYEVEGYTFKNSGVAFGLTRHSGVAFVYRSSLDIDFYNISERLCYLKIGKMVIANCYMPTESKNEDRSFVYDFIAKLKKGHQGQMMVVGDFNCRFGRKIKIYKNSKSLILKPLFQN